MTVPMRLELVHVPVSDVDRAKQFYVEQCGWELTTDHVQDSGMRIVQIVPPGSGCAILLGTQIPESSEMPVGMQKGIHLVVDDMAAARAVLERGGVGLGPVTDMGGVLYSRFEDPDGNSWLVQQWPRP